MASLINLDTLYGILNNVMSGKANSSDVQTTVQGLSTAIDQKASKGNTLTAYGITDAFTKTEVQTLVDQRISALVGTASANLDTLGEIGAQLASDENAVTALTTTVAGKEAKITAGTASQYFRGDKTWSDFASDVRASVLSGLNTSVSVAITATDTVLGAFGKLQAQITALASGISNTISNAITTERTAAATLQNKTLVAPTIVNYTEQYFTQNVSGNYTVDLANGTLQELVLNGNTTITLPASQAGKSYTLIIAYNGAYVPTFTGGTTLKWAGQSAPASKSVAGYWDIFVFTGNGAITFGRSGGSNF